MSQVLTPEPLLARLPSLSPRLAEARDRMLSILSRTIDGLTLKAAIIEDAPAGPWVAFDTAAGRVLLAEADGPPVRDHVEAVARLDRLEPLLAALETDAFVFDPVGVEDAAETDIHLRLDAFDAEQVCRHAVVLALDLAAAEAWPDAAEFAPDLTALAAPLPVALTLDGPTVPADSALGIGDVVLLPFGLDRVLSASLTVGGQRARGLFSPARGGFSINSLEPIPMSDLAVSASVEPPSPDPAVARAEWAADLPVTLRVALGEVTLTAGQLAGLRPGATVVLDVPPGEARAVLLAGDRPVASGRLVALGEAYGLVLDKVGAEA